MKPQKNFSPPAKKNKKWNFMVSKVPPNKKWNSRAKFHFLRSEISRAAARRFLFFVLSNWCLVGGFGPKPPQLETKATSRWHGLPSWRPRWRVGGKATPVPGKAFSVLRPLRVRSEKKILASGEKKIRSEISPKKKGSRIRSEIKNSGVRSSKKK